MEQLVLKIAVIVTLLPHLLLLAGQRDVTAHDQVYHRSPSKAVSLQTVSPQRARHLLSLQASLRLEQQDSKDVKVKSSVLCFCLHKAGHAIQELRRLQSVWFDKGRMHFTAQNYTEAITAFTRVIEMNVRDARVYINRGLSYANRGDFPSAVQDFTRAVGLNQHQAEAYYARGLIALIEHDMSAASLDLQKAADLQYAPAQSLLYLTQVQSAR